MTGGGWRYQQDWQRRGAMNPGMMGQGWMMGSGNVGPGPSVMMRMIFTLMDSDGDGTVSLQEFQAAHERAVSPDLQPISFGYGLDRLPVPRLAALGIPTTKDEIARELRAPLRLFGKTEPGLATSS